MSILGLNIAGWKPQAGSNYEILRDLKIHIFPSHEFFDSLNSRNLTLKRTVMRHTLCENAVFLGEPYSLNSQINMYQRRTNSNNKNTTEEMIYLNKNQKDFFKILYMPEPYILYRYFFEEKGYTEKWWQEFDSFNASDKRKAKKIIETNKFNNISLSPKDENIKIFINKYYKISRDDVNNPKSRFYKEKKEYDKIKFKNRCQK
jgi:hypothetical protein